MSLDVATLGIKVDATGAISTLGTLDNALAKTGAAGDKLTGVAHRQQEQLLSLARNVGVATGPFDSFTSRIINANGGMEAFAAAQRRLASEIPAVTSAQRQLAAEIPHATESLKQQSSAMGALGDTAKKLALGVATLAGAFAIWAIKKSIHETIEAQNAMAQLEAAIKSTGGAAGLTVGQLDKMSNALQKTSTYSDDAIKGAQAVLLTFTEIRGAEFGQATQAVVDLATRMGTDLKSAALQVGKALQDPEHGLTALTRAGVTFSGAQKEVIKNLFATGQAAEAQRLILAELEREFGGSADAARNTLGGALTYLQNQWDDLFHVSDTASKGIVRSINAIADALPNIRDQAVQAFGDAITWIQKFGLRLEAVRLDASNAGLALHQAFTFGLDNGTLDTLKKQQDRVKAIRLEYESLDRAAKNAGASARNAAKAALEGQGVERIEISGGGAAARRPEAESEANAAESKARRFQAEFQALTLEIEKQRELNAAVGQTATQIKILEILYDTKTANSKLAASSSGSELAALRGLNNALAEQKIKALELAEAEATLKFAREEETKAAQHSLDVALKIINANADEREARQTALFDKTFPGGRSLSTATGDSVKDAVAIATANAAELDKALAASAEKMRLIMENLVRGVQSAFSDLFTGIFSGATDSAAKFFQSLRQTFARVVSEILAAKLVEKLIKPLSGVFGLSVGKEQVLAATIMRGVADDELKAAYIRAGISQPAGGGGGGTGAPPGGSPLLGGALIGLAGFGAGYGVGRGFSGGDRAVGAFGGAAAGAATGAALGSIFPGIGTAIGGVIGGLTGLAGGLLGASSAAKEAAAQLKEMRKALDESIAAFRVQAQGGATLQDQQAQVHRDADKLRQEAYKDYPGTGPWYNPSSTPNPELAKRLADIAAAEALYIQRLIDEAKIKNQIYKEDLQVRLLRAQGNDKEADMLATKLAQARELAALDEQIRLGLADEGTRALLLQVQAAELLKKSVDTLTTSVRNAPTGFKIEPYINRFAEARPYTGPVPVESIPYSPTRPTGNVPKYSSDVAIENNNRLALSRVNPFDAVTENINRFAGADASPFDTINDNINRFGLTGINPFDTINENINRFALLQANPFDTQLSKMLADNTPFDKTSFGNIPFDLPSNNLPFGNVPGGSISYPPERPTGNVPKYSTGLTINGNISMTLPNVTSPEKVGPAFMTYLHKVADKTVGPNAPLADALEYA